MKKKRRSVGGLILALILIAIIVAALAIGIPYFLNFLSSNENSDSSSNNSSSSSSSSMSSDSSSSSVIDDSSSSSSSSSVDSSSSTSSNVEQGFTPISYYFLDLNTYYTGDCTYIKAGDYDILIDGGARKAQGATITNFLNEHVEDKVLEYVIVTHAHQDHIAGLVGSQNASYPSGRTGVLYNFAVETLIDFPKTDATTAIYGEYLEARERLIEDGTTYLTALEALDTNNGIIDLGTGLSMQILYNFYYDHEPSDSSLLDPSFSTSGFSNENDYSVAVLFSQGENHALFSGDCEEYSEKSLVDYNDLPECDLFKAGHHGSYTASSSYLLDVIKPETIVVEATAGTSEYASDANHSFPAQEAIDRFAKYTDSVYVTQVGNFDNRSYEPLNGTITVSYDSKGNQSLAFTSSSLKLKDTEWFLNNRTMPEEWREESL